MSIVHSQKLSKRVSATQVSEIDCSKDDWKTTTGILIKESPLTEHLTAIVLF